MSGEPASESMAIVINRDGMGRGDQELQHKLLRTFLRLVLENGKLPGAICLYTDGVRLATADSPVLAELRALEERGVHVILCKTCLDHLGLAGSVEVGTVGGMGDIIAAQWIAGKVVTL